MKIGILTEIINYHSGARAPLELAKYLTKRNHMVTIYAYDLQLDTAAYRDLKKNGVNLVIVKLNPIPQIGRLLATITLLKILRKSHLHAIIFTGTLAFFFAGKLAKIPIIRMYMGTQFDAILEDNVPTHKPLLAQVINILGNLYVLSREVPLTYLSNGFVAISNYAGKEAKRLYKRDVDGTIYLGTTHFQKKTAKSEKKKDTILLLSVSRITPYKGFHLMIEALQQTKKKNIHLIIAGSQPKQQYIKYIKKIGGTYVTILINPTDQELSRLYQQADIYLCADRYLHFGLTIFEAAQFGKPTIALDLGAARELIQHGKTGYVANDLNEFAYYLQKLIEDERLRNKLGYNAMRWSKTFSWEESARKWEKILYKYAKKQS